MEKSPSSQETNFDIHIKKQRMLDLEKKVILEKVSDMKQETLGQAAERILANNVDGLRDALNDDDLFFFYKGVIQCYGESMAEYQAERSYSEVEVLQLLLRLQETEFYDNLYDWFEQFKKK